jgi:two-component system phosphate regulon sensor histidine kinase PhoR
MFRQLRWRIAIPYLALVLLAMVGLAAHLSTLVRDAYLADLRGQLTNEARLVGEATQSAFSAASAGDSLDGLARHYADALGARVTLIAADGTVLGESQEDRSQMDNHLYRDEVQQALARGLGVAVRSSSTTGYDMMYVAATVKVEGKVVGIARLALALGQIEANVARLRMAILVATLVSVWLAALIAVLIAERIAQPVRGLTEAFDRLAAGDLDVRLLPSSQDEVGQLTRAFDQTADRLRDVIGTLGAERSRLAAVLEHMADGAVMTDAEGRVSLLNPAAQRLLATNESAALGRTFAQVARDYRLIEVWRACRARGQEQTQTVEMDRRGPFVRVVVTPLAEVGPQPCLVILQDLTEVRKAEVVRRDLVSNVSHELRTPLASLKALTETLRDGALQDPPAARHFLEQMETEVDALTQLVEELLELARIESGRVPIVRKPTSVSEIVVPPVERLQPQAERAGLTLSTELPSDLPEVQADLQRMQQVVVNLVHNAIKFTPSGGQVVVAAKAEEQRVVISVSDTGVGIPEEALPRIFERFYKADRARSSAGTGLGLAIAKHIVEGHGGRVWAESVEGRGSSFHFSLPLAATLPGADADAGKA